MRTEIFMDEYYVIIAETELDGAALSSLVDQNVTINGEREYAIAYFTQFKGFGIMWEINEAE